MGVKFLFFVVIVELNITEIFPHVPGFLIFSKNFQLLNYIFASSFKYNAKKKKKNQIIILKLFVLEYFPIVNN